VAAGTQTLVAAAGETGKYAGERTVSHHEKVNSQRISEDFKDPKEARKVEKMIKDANTISQKELQKQETVVKARDTAKNTIERLDRKNIRQEDRIKQNKGALKTLKSQKNPSNTRQNGPKFKAAAKRIKVSSDRIDRNNLKKADIKRNMPSRSYMTDKKNFHLLEGDHRGQASMDLDTNKPAGQTWRGSERVILETDPNLKSKTGQQFSYAGRVENHDYQRAPKPGELKPVYNPHDALPAERLGNINLRDVDDEEKGDSKKNN